MMIKKYSELRKLNRYEDRFNYLKLNGVVGRSTFGYNRYINQAVYTDPRWRELRRKLIIRDNGCDMGHPDHVIKDRLILHHINPITAKDIENGDPKVYDPENLICVSEVTHNAIHYGDEKLLPKPIVERSRHDTSPWKKKEE